MSSPDMVNGMGHSQASSCDGRDSFSPVSLVSPLKALQFASESHSHPDRAKVDYVLSGIAHSFASARKNKASAYDHPEIVDAYLRNEVTLGRVAGPFITSPFPELHISSFGIIPKAGQPGEWRLILYLSSPQGFSVNDGIDPEQFSLQYIKFDVGVENCTWILPYLSGYARRHSSSLLSRI